MSATPFLDRAFRHLPRVGSSFQFDTWKHPGRTTAEGVGVKPVTGLDVDRMAACIMNVDGYTGNIDYVVESRNIDDPRFQPPGAQRFYQRIKLPVIGDIQMELVLTDHGEREGWRTLSWTMLGPETDRLDPKKGARFEYNDGAWLLREDAVGYALSSCPRKADVGRIKFAAMTKGADATAGKMLEGNMDGMVRWSRR